MRRLYLALALLCAFGAAPALAQQQVYVCIKRVDPNGSNQCLDVSATNPFPVLGTFSASGFSGNGSYATLTATASSSASTALPTGTSTRITNASSTATVSCTFATGAATGLVNNILVPPLSSVSRVNGLFDHIACIDQTGSTGSNLVVLEGGSGLGNDTGGGGGGGGAATIADGADVAEGAKADTVCGSDTGTCTLIALIKRLNQTATSAIPAGTATIGTVGQLTYPVGATPITASATGTTGATTATLAGASSKTTYICGYSIRANATAAATVTNTITGVITATLSSIMWVAPLASGIGVDEQIFSPCVPASGTNQAIAVVSGAPGSGGAVSSRAWGYQL